MGHGFEWPDPAWARFWVARPSPNQKNALLAEKLVKNGQKQAKIGGLNWPVAKKGQPDPDPGQKKSGPTQPYLVEDFQ